MWNKFPRGEALIDVVIGTTLIGFFVISTFNVLLGILKESGQITKRIQANWVANSYMEQITHFPFTDPDIDTDSDLDDVDDFDDYSVVNYGLTVTVNVNDAEVDAGTGRISISESSLFNPDFKQVRVTVSDGGLDEAIELKTLVPLDALPPPYITRIYTDYNVDEPPPRYSEQEEDLNIKLVFDREVFVSDIGNITLTLNNMTESVTYGTDGIEGDMWYHNNLLNELVLDDGLHLESDCLTPVSHEEHGYGDALVSKVDEGQDPITATGSSISDNKLELTFTYDLGPDTKYQTSLSFDDYLDVEKINLNGETIEGLVNDNPDGVQALDENKDGFIDLPTEDELMLTNNEVIILNQHGTFYIFYEDRDDGIDGWEQLQAVVNPEEVEEVELPTLGAIFDNWKRFSGTESFNNKAEAIGNNEASAWEAVWAMVGDTDTRLQNKYGLDSLDSFTMPLNVEPSNGFVSENEFEELILETTLYSDNYNHGGNDNDMIGIIVAYEEGTNRCNRDGEDHDPELCDNDGGAEEPYVLIAARTGGGSVPKSGWALYYGRTGPYSCYSCLGNITYNFGVNDWIVDECDQMGGNWLGKYARVKIERNKNLVTAYTTSWIPNSETARADALEAPYLEGEEEEEGVPPTPEELIEETAIQLDAQYEMWYMNNTNYNYYHGGGGMFMQGNAGPHIGQYSQYWYILSDGRLFNGTSSYGSTLIATLSSDYHNDINLLTQAAENAGGVTFEGCDEPVLTADLESDSRLHKFLGGQRDGGSSYGFITFSQPWARFFDVRMPPPAVVEKNVDYVIYFHDRVDTDDDGNYDTWAPFDLTVDNATGDNGRTLCYGLETCPHDPVDLLLKGIVHAHNAKDQRRSGIWKWDETGDTGHWVFRENALGELNALDELLGRTVQEATGHYRIISPDAEMFDGDHMFTDILESPASGTVDETYLIREKFEVAEDYCDETAGVWDPVTNECSY